ncbi:MAG: alginate export family protein [Bizionia sp.]|nr:alginate export family protein [Bizionia sp.]
MKNYNVLMLFLALSQVIYAQDFEVSAELRPRFEYRNGYKTLPVDSLDAAAFVSQRTRLNFDYKHTYFDAYLSIQDVRVWGDVPTLNAADNNGLSVHEAWARLKLASEFSLKLGRQEIVYDNQRVFGSVGWAQQARSHDALLAIYKPNANQHFELGLALNATSESLSKIDYTLNNYKALQYLWYHTDIKNIGLSFLVLNTGFTYYEAPQDEKQEEKVDYNQTLGAHVTFLGNKVSAEASVYVQTGKIANRNLSAFNAAGQLNYSLTQNFTTGFGAEYLSGTDMNTSSSDIKSFTPWFGTNHKFNGAMDYFYVGSHANSVGLIDAFINLKYQKNKLKLNVTPHMFWSAANVVNNTNETMDDYLGTEIDIKLTYNWQKEISFQVGYSHLFGTETLEVLKGGNHNATTHWGWAMVTIKPSLFKTAANNQ